MRLISLLESQLSNSTIPIFPRLTKYNISYQVIFPCFPFNFIIHGNTFRISALHLFTWSNIVTYCASLNFLVDFFSSLIELGTTSKGHQYHGTSIRGLTGAMHCWPLPLHLNQSENMESCCSTRPTIKQTVLYCTVVYCTVPIHQVN